MPKKVERTKTEVSMPELVQSFARAWQSLLGRKPSKEQLAMFVSQNSLETGSRKSMYNNNIGNIIQGGSGFDYFEGMDTQAGKPFMQKFRSYTTLDEGVLDYLKLLYKGYPQAFAAASGGDPKEYAHSLLANPKHQYYDATVEKSYAAGMNRLYSQYMKSKEFDQAYNNAVGGKTEEPSMVAQKDDLLKKYLEKNKGQMGSVYDQIGGGKQVAVNTPAPAPAPAGDDLMSTVNKYLQQIIASEKDNKKLYKKFLPVNHLVIHVKADNSVDAIEFSRILCAALDEELMASATTHIEGDLVEVGCSIHGPANDCFETVKQLTQSLSGAFKSATKKIGGIEVKTQFSMNKRSSYQQIDVISANTQHRKFLLKFI